MRPNDDREDTKLALALKRAASQFEHAEGGNIPSLMMHAVIGYPSLEESLDIARHLASQGAAILELQIPFSDPLADGPTIMMANEVALKNGITPTIAVSALGALAGELDIPILCMTYFNIALCYPGGCRGFVQALDDAGVSGMIIPDLPPEEDHEGLRQAAEKAGLSFIPLVSPLSNEKRLRMLSQLSSASGNPSFVYCVSTTGTTGARGELPEGLDDYLSRVRETFDLPLALGFGISSRHHLEELARKVEIAIVGSATIERIAEADQGEGAKSAAQFMQELTGQRESCSSLD